MLEFNGFPPQSGFGRKGFSPNATTPRVRAFVASDAHHCPGRFSVQAALRVRIRSGRRPSVLRRYPQTKRKRRRAVSRHQMKRRRGDVALVRNRGTPRTGVAPSATSASGQDDGQLLMWPSDETECDGPAPERRTRETPDQMEVSVPRRLRVWAWQIARPSASAASFWGSSGSARSVLTMRWI